MASDLKHIVCIDDDPDILVIAQMCLEDIGGYQVTCFGSARDGIAQTPEIHPDLIMLDVMMPGMDGPAALKALRDNPALDDVPIVFMSARVQSSEVQDYYQLGVNGVIPKPFSPDALSSQVRVIWSGFMKERGA